MIIVTFCLNDFNGEGMDRILPNELSNSISIDWILSHVNTKYLHIIRMGIIPYTVDKDGNMLVLMGIKTKNVLFGDFGGGCSQKELPLEGLKREILEEAGTLFGDMDVKAKLKEKTTLIYTQRVGWKRHMTYLSCEFLIRVDYDCMLPLKFNVVNGEHMFIQWLYLSTLTANNIDGSLSHLLSTFTQLAGRKVDQQTITALENASYPIALIKQSALLKRKAEILLEEELEEERAKECSFKKYALYGIDALEKLKQLKIIEGN